MDLLSTLFLLRTSYSHVNVPQPARDMLNMDLGRATRCCDKSLRGKGGAEMTKTSVVVIAMLLALVLPLASTASADEISGGGTISAQGAGLAAQCVRSPST